MDKSFPLPLRPAGDVSDLPLVLESQMLLPPPTPVLALHGKPHWNFPVGHRPGSGISVGGILVYGVCGELSVVFSFGHPAMLLS